MHDVVIVGAGLAGLTAARRLAEAGLDAVVVEARDRLGGRVFTEVRDGVALDLGGQWIGPGQPRMAALVEELGLRTWPTRSEGRHTLVRAGRVSRYNGTIPRLNPLSLVRVGLALRRLEALAARLSPVAPWTDADAALLDGQTFATFAADHLDAAGLDVLRPAMRTVFGAELEELSALHVAAYAASAGGFERLLAVDGGFQQDRIEGGAQRVAEGLAEKVAAAGGQVRLGWPVLAVEHGPDGVTVTGPAGALTARAAILTLPPALCSRVHFTPQLPPLRDQLHQRAPMGATIKLLAAYDRAFWRDTGLSGEVVCAEGPISVVFDNTPPDGPPMLLAFIVGGPARAGAGGEGWLRARLGELAAWLGPQAAAPVWTRVMDWTAEPWSGGCPIGLLPPGTWTRFGPALRAPVGRLHWAGTETATSCTGFMEGAVESGARAAREVLGARAS